MSVIDDLLESAGSYVGRGWFAPAERPPRVARLLVVPLPGRSGVALDYDVISVEGELRHREHSLLARVGANDVVLLVAYEGDEPAALLHEIEVGFFAERQTEPYRPGQMGIRIETPDSGHVRHAYCWVGEDGAFVETDVADLRLVR